MSKVYGKIEFGWNASVILPLDQASKFVELAALGLYRSTGEYPNRGVTRYNEEGRPIHIPGMEILTQEQVDALLKQGIVDRQADAAKRAAEKAEAGAAQPA